MITFTVRELQSWREKTLGLIGTSRPEAVSFHTRWGIHTFGVRFPIDVLILDDTNRIKVLKPDLRPNRFWFWSPRYHHVIELPSGVIKAQKFRLNQQLKLSKV